MKSMESAVFRRIDADRGPRARLRSLSRLPRFALLVVVVAVEVAFFYLLLRRSDLGSYPGARMALTLGGYGIVLLASAWLALRPLYLPDRPRARTLLLAGGLMLPVVLALLPQVPGGLLLETRDDHIQRGWQCLASGTLAAAAVLLTGWLLDRGAGPGLVLASVAAGTAAVLALFVHCPINYPVHLLVAHATVPFLAVAAGQWLYRRRQS